MVNPGESLINVVNPNKSKMLTRLEPTGVWSGPGVFCSPGAVGVPPADRRDLTRAGIQAERGKPVSLLDNQESEPRGELTEVRVKDAGASEGHLVTRWIGVQTLPRAQARRLPAGVSSRESMANRASGKADDGNSTDG
jgi:hypothetical protein